MTDIEEEIKKYCDMIDSHIDVILEAKASIISKDITTFVDKKRKYKSTAIREGILDTSKILQLFRIDIPTIIAQGKKTRDLITEMVKKMEKDKKKSVSKKIKK